MRLSRFSAFALFFALACPADDDAGEGADSGSTSTATTMTTSASTTTSSTTDGSATDGGSSSTTTGATAGDSSGDGPATEASSDGGESGPVSCEPGSDGDCIECVKASPCCDYYVQCRADEICSCTLDCGLAGGSFGSCSSQCGGQNDYYKSLYFCGQQSCLGACDWPKPSGG